jgi:putative BNR repeat neuraminidase
MVYQGKMGYNAFLIAYYNQEDFMKVLGIWLLGIILVQVEIPSIVVRGDVPAIVTLNQKDTGYRGIWYMNQPSGDEYVYKYSGGLGTYCAKHKPFAVYCAKAHKTFFCYGGTNKDSNRKLVHMVSYFDHATGKVPRPTVLLDKKTSDAHDNPVIAVDAKGYIWIFSTSHGTSRPSYIHKSKLPYDINEFELIPATKIQDGKEVPITNFSYMQSWYLPDKGFICFFTRYNYPADRTSCFMTSSDGVKWSQWQRLAAIGKGHYQISACKGDKAGTAFNYHPDPKGLNWRTNLYYIETLDFGKTWHNAAGQKITVPLTQAKNAVLVNDYQTENLNVYLKDIRYDEQGRPVILFITSKGYQSGPKNDPRTWTTARWTGTKWEIRPAFTSDNNYDMGSLYLENNDTWRIIAPTQTGPQPYNPGGEIALWISKDRGQAWKMSKQVTRNSPRNHTYARQPVNAHPDFYALWADGHGRKPSPSNLYFSDQNGNVFLLPREMKALFETPIRITP